MKYDGLTLHMFKVWEEDEEDSAKLVEARSPRWAAELFVNEHADDEGEYRLFVSAEEDDGMPPQKFTACLARIRDINVTRGHV